MIEYIIKSTLCLGMSIFIYYILIKPENNFSFNRFYLMATLLLALTVPVLNFSSVHAVSIINKINISTIYETSFEGNPVTADENPAVINTTRFTIQKLLLWVYMAVTIILVMRFVFNLRNLVRRMKKNGMNMHGFHVIIMNTFSNSHSFFNYLFISRNDFENKEYFNSLLEHEKAHSKQFHSIDIILTELITCFLWFNPLVWIYKKAISENHEYLADSKVIHCGHNKEKYLNHIIQHSNNKLNTSMLVSGFSFKHTKNRIIMLNKARKPFGKNAFKLVLAIALTGIFLTLNSFKNHTTKSLLVVVDAGHGGKDVGANINNINEKDINLSICSKLAALNGKENIKIVLTRPEDKFLTLENRVDIVNELKPDLFISIHCNYTNDNSIQGMEVFYSQKEAFIKQSYKYGKTIQSEFLKNVFNNRQIKTADYNIFRNSECPSMILQLGFLSNNHDLSLLTDDDYQDQIANTIYNSLVKISNSF